MGRRAGQPDYDSATRQSGAAGAHVLGARSVKYLARRLSNAGVVPSRTSSTDVFNSMLSMAPAW